MTDVRCLYFGCWNTAGHYLVGPGGRRSGLPANIDHALSNSLDGAYAPRRSRSGAIVWGGDHYDSKNWELYQSEECPEGQFLRHEHRGYTLLQWWDRCQGDTRGACNSTILLEGEHTTEELLEALRTHFPHVLENLTRAGVQLVEVRLEKNR